MDGKGYEPIPSATLDSLLNYLQVKYSKSWWITTFDNLAMYELLRKNVTFTVDANCITFDLRNVEKTIKRYEHPQAILTLKFSGANLDFMSDGLVDYWYEKGDSYVSIDLRKSNKLLFIKSL